MKRLCVDSQLATLLCQQEKEAYCLTGWSRWLKNSVCYVPVEGDSMCEKAGNV